MKWEQINEDGFGDATNISARGMAVFKNHLYVGVFNLKIEGVGKSFVSSEILHDGQKLIPRKKWCNILEGLISKGCEIWRWDGKEWECIVGDKGYLKRGFGNKHNWEASFLIPFKDKIYAGILNIREGCEIWRSSDGIEWEQVVGKNAEIKNGFNNPFNKAAWTAEIFKDYLYVGTINWMEGCEIWRTKDGKNWEQVVGRKSKTPNGFKRIGGKNNVFAWSMREYKGNLYVGTAHLKWHVFPRFFFKILFRPLPISKGCQIWKTEDGKNWKPVVAGFGIRTEMPNGFGDRDNWGARRMKIMNGNLYVGTATNVFECYKACEIWRYDGKKWEKLVGENGKSKYGDGFDDVYNKYAWGMEVYRGYEKERIYVGVGNPEIPARKGSEIWYSENGIEWFQEIGDEAYEEGFGLPDGFGDRSNRIRCMQEFNDELYAGTYNLRTGCEIWRRKK